MKLPDNYTILFKNVKHVGIRVSHDQRVRIVVPNWLPEHHLENILKKREDWIQKHLHRLRTRKQPVPLSENQILFKGKIFHLNHNAQFNRTIEIDEEHLIIRAGDLFLEKNRQLAWYRNEARKYFEQQRNRLGRATMDFTTIKYLSAVKRQDGEAVRKGRICHSIGNLLRRHCM